MAPATVLVLEYRDACAWVPGLLACSKAAMLGACKLWDDPTHTSQHKGKEGIDLLAWPFTFGVQVWFSSQANTFRDCWLLPYRHLAALLKVAETSLGNLSHGTCPRLTKQRHGAELTPPCGEAYATPVHTVPGTSRCHLSLQAFLLKVGPRTNRLCSVAFFFFFFIRWADSVSADSKCQSTNPLNL